MPQSPPPERTINSLEDLTPDERNANRGTARGRALLGASLANYGAGRSILADRNGRVIAGNKTLEQAKAMGLKARVIKSDGSRLVVVQRTDLDLKADPKAKALAIADNRVGEIDLDWDADRLNELASGGVDMERLGFMAGEIGEAPPTDPEPSSTAAGNENEVRIVIGFIAQTVPRERYERWLDELRRTMDEPQIIEEIRRRLGLGVQP